MTRLWIGVLVVAFAVVTGLAGAAILTDPEHVKPEHLQAANAAAQVGTTTLYDVGEVDRFVEWIEGVLRAEEVERERIAEAERLAAMEAARARSRVGVASTGSATVAVECGNTVLPDSVVQRESGGRCDAYNATGCGGRGCLGYAQIDSGHFAAVSPWNPSVAGTCYELSYNECVEKLWNGGAGAGHWR